MRIDDKGDREASEDRLLDALIRGLEDLEVGVERCSHGHEDERVVQRGREGRFRQVGEDNELDVVSRGDAPEEREGNKERRPEEQLLACVDPREHGERVRNEGRQAGHRLDQGRQAPRRGRHRDVDVLERGVDVEKESDRREAEEEVVQREVLDVERQRGQEIVRRRAKTEEGEDACVPEAGSCTGTAVNAGVDCTPSVKRTLEACDDENANDEKDPLDRARERRQEESARVELLPRADIEVGLSRDETGDGPPGQAEVEGRCGQKAAEGRVERVTTVVKQLTELRMIDMSISLAWSQRTCAVESGLRGTVTHGTAGSRSPRLLPIDGIERLVGKETRRKSKVQPPRRAVVREMGRTSTGKPGEEVCQGRGFGRSRREERVPRAALGDVQGFCACRKSRVVVEKGEEVEEDERETLVPVARSRSAFVFSFSVRSRLSLELPGSRGG